MSKKTTLAQRNPLKVLDLLKCFLKKRSVTVLGLDHLARRAGYKNSRNRDFRSCLRELEKLGVIQIQQSGFLGHSLCHRKVVALKMDIMILHEDLEFEEVERQSDTKLDFETEEEVCSAERLVKVKDPLGTVSYISVNVNTSLTDITKQYNGFIRVCKKQPHINYINRSQTYRQEKLTQFCELSEILFDFRREEQTCPNR